MRGERERWGEEQGASELSARDGRTKTKKETTIHRQGKTTCALTQNQPLYITRPIKNSSRAAGGDDDDEGGKSSDGSAARSLVGRAFGALHALLHERPGGTHPPTAAARFAVEALGLFVVAFNPLMGAMSWNIDAGSTLSSSSC